MKYLVPAILLLFTTQAFAQKCLQMEKYGSTKRDRIYIGETITFTLFNDDTGWKTRMITDFDVENGFVVFGQQRVHIDSIASIQLDKRNGMKFLGTVFMAGGANTILFSIGYPLAIGASPEWVGVGWGAGFLGLGYLLRKLDRPKKFKIGKRKRLRLLDLTMIAPPLESRS